MALMGKGGGGKGKGWGREQSILQKAAPEKKVWVGGIPPVGDGSGKASRDEVRALNKDLQEHMKKAGECKWAEVRKNGTGGAVYTTPEEAQAAIQQLNGSTFRGAQIQ